MSGEQKQQARESAVRMVRARLEANRAALAQAYDDWLFYSRPDEIRALWRPWMGRFPEWARDKAP
jgi:hypothetical protein